MISPSTPVDSVEATVSYDPTAVRLVSVDGSASAFPIELQNVSTPNSLTLARGILGGNTTANDSLVANLTFTAIKSSTDTTLSVKGNAAYAGSYTDPSPIGAKISIVSPIAIDPTEAADTTPPTVEIASPVPNATATKFNIYAGASDNSGIAKTELYIDGAVVQSTNTGTVSYNWNVNSKRIAKGQHDITVKAYDNAGNTNSKNLTVYKK